jgi:hypothetical protein
MEGPQGRSCLLCVWNFNGTFQDRKVSFNVKAEDNKNAEIIDRDGERDITSLNWYPLHFADPEDHEKLVVRGHNFWQCRKARLVSYVENEKEENLLKKVRCNY